MYHHFSLLLGDEKRGDKIILAYMVDDIDPSRYSTFS